MIGYYPELHTEYARRKDIECYDIEARVHRLPPGPDRWKERSRTFLGIAKAMAEQWG